MNPGTTLGKYTIDSFIGGGGFGRVFRAIQGGPGGFSRPVAIKVLRPGARANVVIWSGDPLELQTEVKQLIIGGRGVPLRSRQTELRDRYRDLSR